MTKLKLLLFSVVLSIVSMGCHFGIKANVTVYDEEQKVWKGFGCVHMSRQNGEMPYGSCVTVHDEGDSVGFRTCSRHLRVEITTLKQ